MFDPPFLGAAALATTLVLHACATESVTQVVVTSVTVQPANVALVEGGTLAFEAVVAEQGGTSLDEAAVLWSSDDPEIVTVSGSGVVRAISNGVATVHASFGDVTGSATVTVLPGPSLTLEPGVATLFGGSGAEPPDPIVVRVGNGGIGVLRQLEAVVEHADGSDEWLTAELAADATPTTLTLAADTEELGPGHYDAAVVLTSGDAGVESFRLSVRLTLAGFVIEDTRGGTSVGESGATDRFSLALDLAPDEEVVLAVESEDPAQVTVSPSRLTFTDADWATPQQVTVTGVDNRVVDGDRTHRVIVSVDDTNDDAYSVVGDRIVEVRVLDDDVADFLVTETGVGTVAREGAPTDTLVVVLSAEPLSDVVLSARTDDPSDARLEPSKLTFTPDTWDTPRILIFTAVDDDVSDGIGFPDVTIAVDPSESDEAFHGLSKTIDAITFDNDLFRASQPGPGG